MGCYIYLSWSVTARMLPPRTGSPCYNISTCQYGSTRGMNFPYISELVLYSSAVTAKFCVAPRYNASICQNCRKSTVSWMHFTHVSELTLDCSAVTAHAWIAPRYNASISQSRSKSISCGMNLLNVSELIHHCSVIAAHVLITPGCNASIIQNCSKRSVGCMNLLNVSEQIYNSGAVTACMWTAPCYHASIYQKCSLKEDSVATICWTFLIWSRTAALPSPWNSLPHVTIWSPPTPTHHNANACDVAATFGCCATAQMPSPSAQHVSEICLDPVGVHWDH